ncbi:unnamed protein product [Peronospora belbahrii]|nr:unnamed protein product [Peronospora belbahrii]
MGKRSVSVDCSEDVLRSYATSFTSWSLFLPLARFAINNAVDASTGLTTFFVSTARHPRVSAHLAFKDSPHTSSTLGGGVSADGIAPEHLMINYVVDKVAHDASHAVNFVANGVSSPDTMHPVTPSLANFAPTEFTSLISSAAVTDLILLRQGITRFVHDALQQAVDKQKENEAKRGRKHLSIFNEGDKALFSTSRLQAHP